MKFRLLLVLVLLLTACSSGSDEIKIGVLADLTGDYAPFLIGIHQGAQLAVDDLETPVKLIIGDQRSCDKKETATIMNKFISIDKVDFIVGGTCSSTTLAAAPIAEQAKTVMISPSSSAPSISTAGDYVFRTYISDALRGEVISKVAYDLGKRKMALIFDISNDAFFEVVEKGIETFEELGGEIVINERVTKENLDLRTALTKVKSKNPDVIFIALGPAQSAKVAKEAVELGIKTQIVSPMETIEDPDSFDIAGEAMNGIIYVMPGTPSSEEFDMFNKKYLAKYGEEAQSFAAEAYDATMLGVKAFLASDGTKEDIRRKLYEVSKTYKGVSGSVAFDENGDVKKEVQVKQVVNGEFVEFQG